MYGDAINAQAAEDPAQWNTYLAQLRRTGLFDGGSSVGPGEAHKKNEPLRPVRRQLDGFIRVRAASRDDAKTFLAGNPVYEAGGTVEIFELWRD